MEIDFSIQRNTNRNQSREEIAADSIYRSNELLPAWLTRREDGSRNTGASLQLNCDHPWGRHGQLGIGGGLRANSQRDDQSTRLFEDPEETVPDQLDDRLVSRRQHVGSLFLTMNRRMGKVGLNLGLRSEWVSELVRLPDGVDLDRNEANLFPNLNLNWTPRPRMQVRLGYSQRVNRPGVSVLDPTNRSTDPLNRSVGNPDIRSSLTRNLTLGFNWGGKKGQFTLGPY